MQTKKGKKKKKMLKVGTLSRKGMRSGVARERVRVTGRALISHFNASLRHFTPSTYIIMLYALRMHIILYQGMQCGNTAPQL